MNERTRNIIVGLTVLGAFVVLGILVVMFAKLPGALRGGREVDILLDGTGGVKAGHDVHLYGIRVGYISDVGFSAVDDPDFRIKMTARVDSDVVLPPDTICLISRPMLGNAWVELVPNQSDFYKRTGRPQEGVLYGQVRAGGPFAEIRSILQNVLVATEDLIEMIGPIDAADVPVDEAGLRGAVIRLNRTLEEYHLLAGEVRQTNEDLRGHLNNLAPKLVHSADEIALLLSGLQRLVARVERGEGTAGRLMTDERLYIELVDTVEQITALMEEMKLLVRQWREEGVGVRLE